MLSQSLLHCCTLFLCSHSCLILVVDWLKVEDIHDQLYINKYTIESKQRDGRGLGQRQPWSTKLLAGCTLVSALIFVIWFPLLLMSLLNAQSISNTPTTVSLSVSVDLYEPLFYMDVLMVDEHVNSDEYALLASLDPTNYISTFKPTVPTMRIENDS